MEKVDCLLLHYIALTGSLTQAAEHMHIQKSHASRLLSRMENQLGLRLIERSTRSMRFTEAGQKVLMRARHVLETLDEIDQFAREQQHEVSGELLLSCGVEFGQIAASQWVNTYLARYPSVKVQMQLSNRRVDVIEENFDLAIRVGEDLSDSSLNVRRIGDLHYGLFASPDYLQQHAPITTINDLAGHSAILFVNGQGETRHWQWLDSSFNPKSLDYRLKINSHFAAIDAVRMGLGIACLPKMMVEQDSSRSLVQILPQHPMRPTHVYALFAERRLMSPKVRSFIDLAVELFAKNDY